MSKLVQRYQSEFGMAIIKELQRNQERSRRGSTPLQPSLGQTEARAASDATAKANQAQANAQYNAANDAAWRADNAYQASVQHTNNTGAAANAYTNQQVGAVWPHVVPGGASVLWDMQGAIPSGWSDTGYTVTMQPGNVQRRVIRKVI